MSHRISSSTQARSDSSPGAAMSMSTATAAAPGKPAAKSPRKTGAKKARKPATAGKKAGTARKPRAGAKAKTATKKKAKKTSKAASLVISKGAAKVKRQKSGSRDAKNGSSGPVRSRTSRVLKRLTQMGREDQEQYFASVDAAELIDLFDGSFPADLVNILMGMKPFTCRGIFETLVSHRKKAYLDTITLYYYNKYLTNPLPMKVGSAVNSFHFLPNYYAITGLAKDATESEISEAARLLLKAFDAESFHPSERTATEEKRAEIRKAFNQLKSEKRRQEMDRELPSINHLYPRRDQSWIGNVERLIP